MNKIENLKEELEYCQKQYGVAKKNLDAWAEELEKAQRNFRIAEVERVLHGMRDLVNLNAVENRRFDNYIVHCINCLNGNIDGTIISIDKDVEKAREEADRMVEE